MSTSTSDLPDHVPDETVQRIADLEAALANLPETVTVARGPMGDGREVEVDFPPVEGVETRYEDHPAHGPIVVVSVALGVTAWEYHSTNRNERVSYGDVIYDVMSENGIARPNESRFFGVQTYRDVEGPDVVVEAYLQVPGPDPEADAGGDA